MSLYLFRIISSFLRLRSERLMHVISVQVALCVLQLLCLPDFRPFYLL